MVDIPASHVSFRGSIWRKQKSSAVLRYPVRFAKFNVGRSTLSRPYSPWCDEYLPAVYGRLLKGTLSWLWITRTWNTNTFLLPVPVTSCMLTRIFTEKASLLVLSYLATTPRKLLSLSKRKLLFPSSWRFYFGHPESHPYRSSWSSDFSNDMCTSWWFFTNPFEKHMHSRQIFASSSRSI